jgi:hypothetical protein
MADKATMKLIRIIPNRELPIGDIREINLNADGTYILYKGKCYEIRRMDFGYAHSFADDDILNIVKSLPEVK